MKSWRTVAQPHPDVLQGTFQQSEFAADLSAVRKGKATPEYQDAAAFFERTFITEGMRNLLTQVAQRLNGKGGDPVIQLQTAFGGGKTHTMLAVLHLAGRKGSASKLAGVQAVLKAAQVDDVPQAHVAVLDGNEHSPGQSWKQGRTEIHTLWGELAWQLGGAEGFELVRESDEAGTSPGKDVLVRLLTKYAPCVVLVDELVAYVRQFNSTERISGGTYASNISFAQALTEAVKLVPNAVLLASLPESEVEAAGGQGREALSALEKVFGRVHAVWKPVAAQEAFEIVRRRLFQGISDEGARDEVCRAFAALYEAEGQHVPPAAREPQYLDKLRVAYPIHPEVFDRLYEDWTVLHGFQRTRGVLKLMAQVIHQLWREDNQEPLVMPASLPLANAKVRVELTTHLNPGWDPVLDRDIDSDRSESASVDKDPRFGAVHAARGVARTLFLATAPATTGATAAKGIDAPRVVLGCLQPGQNSADYRDALKRLMDRMHHLNASGDKEAAGTRFWFDTRPTLRRAMEDRRNQLSGKPEVDDAVASAVEKVFRNFELISGVHVFTAHSDVPDDGELRLVVLPLSAPASKAERRLADDAVRDFVKKNGSKPRYRANRLVFVAPEQTALAQLDFAARTHVAWAQLVEEIEEGRLTVDNLQKKQAEREAEAAQAALSRTVRECFKWLLVPRQENATDRDVQVEALTLNSGATAWAKEVEWVLKQNEGVIPAWSPIHLRTLLQELYWKPERPHVGALAVWADFEKYLYLPRLVDRQVFERAFEEGLRSKEYFGIARGEKGGVYEGLQLGEGRTQLDDTVLLVEPGEAAKQKAAQAVTAQVPGKRTGRTPHVGSAAVARTTSSSPSGLIQEPKAQRFFAEFSVKPASAKMALTQLVDELVKHFAASPDADLRLDVTFSAMLPNGATPELKRISENASGLSGMENANSGWEDA